LAARRGAAGRTADSPFTRILACYRELTGASDTEKQLQDFAPAAQTEIAGETNALLALLTVLTLAVAIAAAVITGAAWKGWDVLWASPWGQLPLQHFYSSPSAGHCAVSSFRSDGLADSGPRPASRLK
jgi:hypothetical protein